MFWFALFLAYVLNLNGWSSILTPWAANILKFICLVLKKLPLWLIIVLLTITNFLPNRFGFSLLLFVVFVFSKKPPLLVGPYLCLWILRQKQIFTVDFYNIYFYINSFSVLHIMFALSSFSQVQEDYLKFPNITDLLVYYQINRTKCV